MQCSGIPQGACSDAGPHHRLSPCQAGPPCRGGAGRLHEGVAAPCAAHRHGGSRTTSTCPGPQRILCTALPLIMLPCCSATAVGSTSVCPVRQICLCCTPLAQRYGTPDRTQSATRCGYMNLLLVLLSPGCATTSKPTWLGCSPTRGELAHRASYARQRCAQSSCHVAKKA